MNEVRKNLEAARDSINLAIAALPSVPEVPPGGEVNIVEHTTLDDAGGSSSNRVITTIDAEGRRTVRNES